MDVCKTCVTYISSDERPFLFRKLREQQKHIVTTEYKPQIVQLLLFALITDQVLFILIIFHFSGGRRFFPPERAAAVFRHKFSVILWMAVNLCMIVYGFLSHQSDWWFLICHVHTGVHQIV